jgi:hypothetical protein
MVNYPLNVFNSFRHLYVETMVTEINEAQTSQLERSDLILSILYILINKHYSNIIIQPHTLPFPSERMTRSITYISFRVQSLFILGECFFIALLKFPTFPYENTRCQQNY